MTTLYSIIHISCSDHTKFLRRVSVLWSADMHLPEGGILHCLITATINCGCMTACVTQSLVHLCAALPVRFIQFTSGVAQYSIKF